MPSGLKSEYEQHAFTQNYKLQFFNANSFGKSPRVIEDLFDKVVLNECSSRLRLGGMIASTWVSECT
jgi:hypothetical protein